VTVKAGSGRRRYRYGRTEQGVDGIVWAVYEGPADQDFINGEQVATFLRHEDAWTFIQPLASERCHCGHEMSMHTPPARLNCVQCTCSISWPEQPLSGSLSRRSERPDAEEEEGGEDMKKARCWVCGVEIVSTSCWREICGAPDCDYEERERQEAEREEAQYAAEQDDYKRYR